MQISQVPAPPAFLFATGVLQPTGQSAQTESPTSFANVPLSHATGVAVPAGHL